MNKKMKIRNALRWLMHGLLLMAAGTSSVAAIIVKPPGLNPGDTYRLVFLTDGTTQAGSKFIATYNAFVQGQAASVPALNALGTTWKAIGSTFNASFETSSAIDSTGTNPGLNAGVPIYRLDGVKVANNNADLWDGNLQSPINVTPTTVSAATQVWSGTNPGGDYYYYFPLGGKPFGPFLYSLFGNPQVTTGWLGNNTHEQVVAAFPMYAISGILTVPANPEIAVQQPAGTDLVDGIASVGFGTVNLGLSSAARTFTVTNSGGGALTLGAISVNGTHAGDFSVNITGLLTTLAPAASTTFTVTFTPAAAGVRNAALHITNNDADENPFDINLSGAGNAAPTLSLPASPVLAEVTSASGATVTFAVTASDVEDGPLTPTISPASGSTFALGDTTVNVSATDSGGATTSGSFIVRVRDTTPPGLTCPAGVSAKATQVAGTNVSFTVTATDTVDPAPGVVCTPASGSLFAPGVTPVTCVATDAAGNTNTCSFNVTVRFLSAASDMVNAAVPDNDASGVARTLTLNSPIARITDVNVRLVLSGGWNGDLFVCLAHGTNKAILLNRVGRTATNPLGYGDAGFDITLDDQAANGDVHQYQLVQDPLGGALTGAWAPDGRRTDPAAVLGTDARTGLLNVFNTRNAYGDWTLLVTDVESGDTAMLVSWSLEICGDLQSPLIVTPPSSLTVECTSNATFSVVADGSLPLSYQWLFNGTPIAGATGTNLARNNVHPASAGGYSVVISNVAGVVTSAVAILTVQDTLAPTLTACPADQSICTTNPAGSVAAFTAPTASDACDGVLAVTCVPASGSLFAGGTNVVTCSATDAAGNSNGCTFRVIIDVDRVPVFAGLTITTRSNTPATTAKTKIRARLSDPDGDPVTLTGVATASLNGGGVTSTATHFTYTPPTDFVGVDTIEVTFTDDRCGTATGLIVITVDDGTGVSLNRVSIRVVPSGIELQFAGIPGRPYRIQRAPAATGPWSDQAGLTAPIYGIMTFIDTNPPPGMAFYRTVSP